MQAQPIRLHPWPDRTCLPLLPRRHPDDLMAMWTAVNPVDREETTADFDQLLKFLLAVGTHRGDVFFHDLHASLLLQIAGRHAPKQAGAWAPQSQWAK